MRFTFRVATEADNDALLELVRLCPMAGSVEIGADRAPRFFALNELQGDPWLVAVVLDEAGDVVGCAASAVRDVYVNGRPIRAAYLGDLRIAPRSRGKGILPRLGAFLLERITQSGAELAYTTIVEGNRAAASVPTRTEVVRYVPVAPIRVVALTSAPRAPRDIAVDTATAADVPEIARLLDARARRHQFGRSWSPDALARALRRMPGLSVDRFLVVRSQGRIVAALAAWDQRAFQQRLVLGYHGAMAAFRAAADLRAAVLRRPRLPRPGEAFRELHITHVAVADDDPRAFAALLAEAWRRADGAYHLMSFGLAEGHPLLAALGRVRHARFHTMLYAIPGPGTPWEHTSFAGVPAHEISHI